MKPVLHSLLFFNARGSRPNCAGFAARTLPADATRSSCIPRRQRATASCIADTSISDSDRLAACASASLASSVARPIATCGFPRTTSQRIRRWSPSTRSPTILLQRATAETALWPGVSPARHGFSLCAGGFDSLASLRALRTCQPERSYKPMTTPATPNHALQRTAPRVTVAAISSSNPSRPSVALSYVRCLLLRSTTQLPRRAPQSLSLGSLGAFPLYNANKPAQCQNHENPPCNRRSGLRRRSFRQRSELLVNASREDDVFFGHRRHRHRNASREHDLLQRLQRDRHCNASRKDYILQRFGCVRQFHASRTHFVLFRHGRFHLCNACREHDLLQRSRKRLINECRQHSLLQLQQVVVSPGVTNAPNHALQRTAPRVTVAAISSSDPSRPSVALSYARCRLLRSTTQLPRRALQSLSLGSLGASALALKSAEGILCT